MKRLVFLSGLLLLGACRDREDKKPTDVPYLTLPGLPTTPVLGPVVSTEPAHGLAAGQSNMTFRVGNAEGVSSYFGQDIKVPMTLINTAVGGSTQKEWAPGSPYYANLVAKARTLGHIDVLIWWQGEGEAMFGNLADAKAWGYNFTQFVLALRRDLNQPHLLVIYAQIGTNPAGDHEGGNGVYTSWKEVQDQQASIFLPDTYMVKTDDQNFYGYVHTDEAGYRAVASRMAMVYAQYK